MAGLGFNINQFATALVDGGARPSQFQVIMPFPAVVGSAAPPASLLSFMCDAASIPGEDLGIIPIFYFGRQLKVPGSRQFQEWSITILNDENFTIRGAFESWSNAINGHVSNLRNPAALSPSIPTSGAGSGYQTDATVVQYGKDGTIIANYDMIGCWPSTVSPIELSWEQGDAIEKFQVTLQYQWWSSAYTS